MKKILCIFLSVIMLVSFCFPSFASAAYSVDGPETVYTLGSGEYQKVTYTLKDSSGNVINDAVFSVDSSPAGVFMSPNGELRLMGASVAADTQIMINASYDGNVYQKQITFKTGVSTDMNVWNQTNTLFWGTLAASEWLDKGGGDKYISPSSNKGLKTDAGTVFGIFRVGSATNYTFQFDTLASEAAISKGALFLLQGTESNGGAWWENPSYYNKNTANNTVDIKSMGGTNLGTFGIGSWITVKIVVDTNAGYYDIYMNDNSPVRINNTSKPGINSATIYVPFDNIKMYTGNTVSDSAFGAEITNSPVITRPSSDGTTNVDLTAEVKENGTVVTGHPVNWSLASAYDGVALSDASLVVSNGAPDEIEVKASIPGTSITATKKFYILSPGEENLLILSGQNSFTVPLTGTVTSQYTAKDVFGSDASPDWSVTPQNQGVSIDGSGLLTIDNTASAGTYTINATSGEKSGTFDITTALTPLTIKGDTEIMLPDDDTYVKFSYTLEDSEGNSYPATFGLSNDIDGCFIDQNGTLRLMGAALSATSQLSIIADYGSAHAELPLTFVSGYSEDFTSNYWTSSSNVTSEGSNKYLAPNGTRADSPTIMTSPGFNNLTLEFDYKPSVTAQTLNLGGARTPGDTNDAKWWMEFKAAKSGDTATVNLSSGLSKIAENLSHTMTGDWIKVKIAMSSVTGDVSLYLDGSLKATGSLASTLTDFHIKTIICFADIDNVKVYGGQASDPASFAVDITTPSAAPAPSQQTPTVVNLTADVKENGTLIAGHPVNWSLGVADDKLSLNGDKLTISYGAPSSIDVVAAVPGVGVIDTLSLTLETPDVYIEKTETGLRFKGTAGTGFDVTLFTPLDTANTVKAFLASGDIGVAGSNSESHSFTFNSSGTYDFNMSSYAPGLYKVYVTAGGVENYMEFTHKFESILSSSDAITNIGYEDDFKALLAKYTNMTSAQIEEAYTSYEGITDKDAVASIARGDIGDFGLAVMAIEFAEEVKNSSSYPTALANALASALKEEGKSDTAYTLLGKNSDPKSVISAMDSESFQSLDEYLEELKNNSILFGIRVLVHVDNGRAFLAELGNTKYNTATYDQQTYICSEVGNKTHASISALNAAINALTLPTGDNGTSLGGGVTGSGSVPAAGTSAPSSPVVPPVQNTSLYSDVSSSHWGYNAIISLSNQGIFAGFEGKFRPEDNITRAEFVKVLAVAFELTLGGENVFSDVNSSDWFAPYVNAGYASGLVLGSNGAFSPYANITRQDAALLLYRFAAYSGMTFDDAAFLFSDSASISDYARGAVETMAANGYINGMGDGSFAPMANMTRAQAAQLLYNIIGGSAK